MKKYKMVFDMGHTIDGIEFDTLEEAINDAQETLIMWEVEETNGWERNPDNWGEWMPTESQIEDWDYMIYNYGCWVVEFNEETGAFEDIDNAVWPVSDADLNAIGWMPWDEYVKKCYHRKENS